MRARNVLRATVAVVVVGAIVLVTRILSVAQNAPAPCGSATLDYRTAQSMAAYRAVPYPDDQYNSRVPLPPSEMAYREIDGRHIKDLIHEIVAISHRSRDAGDIMWGRIPGTQSETWTNEWVEAKFRALGLKDMRRQPFDLPPQWFPVSYDFNVIVDGVAQPKLATVRPAVGSGSLPPDASRPRAGVGQPGLGRGLHGTRRPRQGRRHLERDWRGRRIADARHGWGHRSGRRTEAPRRW